MIVAPEKPGDPKHIASFLNVDSNEQKLGAYLGYDNVSHIPKYFRETLQASGMCAKKFSNDGIAQSVKINIDHVPTWLRLVEKVSPLTALQKPSPVKEADALKPLDIPITWTKVRKYEGKAELEEVLKEANISDIPKDIQTIRQDPRLTQSIFSFKDHIRRLYNCQKLQMNIHSLALTYTTSESGQARTHFMEISRPPWESTKSTFADPQNTDFHLEVCFQAADEGENIYQCSDPPPALASFFDASSGEVVSNNDENREIIEGSFGATEHAASPDSAPPGTGKDDVVDKIFTLMFATDGSASEIGSAPGSRAKFKGDNAYKT